MSTDFGRNNPDRSQLNEDFFYLYELINKTFTNNSLCCQRTTGKVD